MGGERMWKRRVGRVGRQGVAGQPPAGALERPEASSRGYIRKVSSFIYILPSTDTCARFRCMYIRGRRYQRTPPRLFFFPGDRTRSDQYFPAGRYSSNRRSPSRLNTPTRPKQATSIDLGPLLRAHSYPHSAVKRSKPSLPAALSECTTHIRCTCITVARRPSWCLYLILFRERASKRGNVCMCEQR